MIKVLHINITDGQEGKGGMARLLHEQMLLNGNSSTLFVYRQEDATVKSLAMKSFDSKSTPGFFSRKPYFSELHAPYLMDVLQSKEFAEADVVHLHATKEYFSYLLFPYLAAKPLVWTLYDSMPYTGGCIHSAHCNKWKNEQCQSCPIDEKRKTPERHSQMYQWKEQIYAVNSFQVVATSFWQAEQVKESVLKGQALERIPLAVDTTVFYPGDKVWFRKELSLPLDKTILVFDCRDGAEEAGLRFLREALKNITQAAKDVLVLALGSLSQDSLKEFSVDILSLSVIPDSNTLANYLRAGDFLVHPHVLDQNLLMVSKAAACALPAVVFDYGPAKEFVEHQQTGYIAKVGDSKDFAVGLQWLLSDRAGRLKAGEAASLKVWEAQRIKVIAAEYQKLYKKALPNRLQFIPKGEAAYDHIAEVAREQAEQAWQVRGKWSDVWADLIDQLLPFGKENLYRGFYVDAYFQQCLQYVDVKEDKEQIWNFIRTYLEHRTLESRCGHLPAKEKALQAAFSRDLRQLFVKYFTQTSLQQFSSLKPMHHEVMFRFWRWVFLNSTAALHLDMTQESYDKDMLTIESGKTGYPKILIQSMFFPHPEEDLSIHMPKLFQANLPIGMKLLTLLWLTNTPLYNGTVQNQAVVLRQITDFCNYAAANLVKRVPEGFVLICLEHFTSSLWRASYIGGNNLTALCAFGDFVRAATLHKYAYYEVKKKKKHHPGRKLRIGYVSMNFRMQAVSFYMANRIFHHDPEKFEVYTYIIKRYTDDMTEKIRQHSDKVFEYDDFKNIEPVIKDIVASDLDILIYADIGMDPVTYQLGALRLAPIQAVLVGHGVTTGLSTIDYYISGDFEPENAQEHYRETLICLPRLGAAQIPPKTNPGKLTRQAIGVPDDAVVLMSCANGLKYHIDRDYLLIQILQQAPKAWIVLKPFQNPNLVDDHLSERILSKARQAGVANRLVILPPLGDPADLWGLLTLADIQLDTYPYGGWTTNMEAVYAGLPILTEEGDMARSRWGAGMLKALGVTAGIAHNEEEYVKWAVTLVNRPDLRKQVQQKIKENAGKILFNGEAAQGVYEDKLMDIALKKIK